MKKNLKIYYGLLSTAVLAQILITVFSLSQNIGYGQKISFLEDKKATLLAEKNLLNQALAKKIAIRELANDDHDDFVAISEVISINRSSSNLALK